MPRQVDDGRGVRAWAAAAIVLACGCRAQVAMAPSDGGGDLAVADRNVGDVGPNGGDGAANLDLAGVDLAVLDAALDGSCPVGPVEVCGNGCDDDGNGFVDDDDPACSAQVLATLESGAPGLERLLLLPQPQLRMFDDNPIAPGAHAVYNHAFAAGVAFVALDAVSEQLLRIQLGSGPGRVQVISTTYSTRDVCVFDGELIVVDATGYLRRLMADGKTQLGMVPLPSPAPGTLILSACASDGQTLFVAAHDTTAGPTEFHVFGKPLVRSTGKIPLPDSLAADGYDRCLDLAWTPRGGWYGLFARSGGMLNDSAVVAELLLPFSFDGGVGAALDAGVLHGLGEYAP